MRTLPVPEDLGRYYETDLARTMRASGRPVYALLQRVLFRRELRRLNSWSDHGTFLDVGCGAGSFALMLHRSGFPVMTADAGTERPEMIKRLIQIPHYLLDFDRCEISGLEPGGQYTVILRHVLEHVKEPYAFLRRMMDYGARRFYVVLPNSDSMERRLLGRYWYLWDPPRHLWHFHAGSLRALCDRVGLEVLALSYDTIPNLAPSLYRFLRLHNRAPRMYRFLEPGSTLDGLSAPLNILLPRNVIWMLAQTREPVRGGSACG
jgi:hypothetical protein